MLPGAKGIDELDVHHFGAGLFGQFYYALGCTHVWVLGFVSFAIRFATPATADAAASVTMGIRVVLRRGSPPRRVPPGPSRPVRLPEMDAGPRPL